MSEKKKEERDAFDIYEETCQNCVEELAKLMPQYTQSVTDLQSECTDSCKKMTEASITMAKEFASATWGPGRYPSAWVKIAADTSDGFLKVATINNKAMIAVLDATRQNVRLFNDNIETFNKLNLNMVKTWQSFLTPPRT